MLENLVRLGYATKGVVYGLIGILAVQAAFGMGGQTTDSSGALQTIAEQPFGQILLVAIAIGLAAYALWRFIETFLDPEHQGKDAKGIGSRIGYFASGLVYSALAVEATSLALGTSSSSGGDGNATAHWTARVLAQPLGRWLVGLGGAIAIGVGCYMVYKAYKIRFRRKLDLRELNSDQQNWIVQVSRFGVAARGIVFVMIGFFLLQAAYQYDPNKARGLDGILQTIARQPFGKFLLALVAFGLVAYAVYMAVQARYRRLHLEQEAIF